MACRSNVHRMMMAAAATWAWASAALAVSTTTPLTIPAPAFRAVQSMAISPIFHNLFEGSVAGDADGSAILAPVHLPQGVLVTGVVGHMVNTGPAGGSIRIFRRRFSTNPNLLDQELARVEIPPGGSAVQTLRGPGDGEHAAVDNGLYVYWVWSEVDDDISLHGVQIEFVEPIFADGFGSGNTAAWDQTTP